MLLPIFSGFVSCLILETLLLAGLIVLLTLNGLLNTDAAETPENTDKSRLFIERYALTPREKDLMELLLTCDDNIKEVAVKMAVSERVAYRHLNNIYEKTGCSSRLQLLRLYYEGKTDDVL